jgi:hypothetical protein
MKKNEIKEMLVEEYKAGIEKLSDLDEGSEERVKLMDDLAKMQKLITEETRVEAEVKDKKKDRWISALGIAVQVLATGASVYTCILGINAYNVWDMRHMEFEKTGSFVSPQSRNLISKMTPKIRLF